MAKKEKSKATSSNKKAKSEKERKKLSPLEKARIARASGKGKKASKKAKPIVFKPTDEWKNFNFEVFFKTEKDGMLGGQIRVIRYAGQIKDDTPDDKKFDVATYDPTTVIGIASRLNGVLFHATGRPRSNGDPTRLPASTTFKAVGRVSVVKDGSLKAALKQVFISEKVEKKGKTVIKSRELDKKDFLCRKIRKVNKYLAAAFVNSTLPPKPERKSRRKDADEE